MNPTSNPAATAGNGGDFDPRQAAALLDQTTEQARRQFEAHPPWFMVARGIGALIVFGAIWLSVRGQHPYQHPTAAAIPGGIIFGLLSLAAATALSKRATAGVTGRSRLHPAEVAVLAAIWAGVFVIMGVMAGAGVSDGIVYGLYPATVPLIAAGLAWAGIMAVRANWRMAGGSLAIVAVGAGGLFAGPAGGWLVVGVGVCAVLLASAAVVAWRHRA
jgi:hypothetical protein